VSGRLESPVERPPLLGEDADDELLREIADHQGGPGLPLALPSEVRGCRRKDEGRPRAEDPIPGVCRGEQLQESDVAEGGGAVELTRRRLVRHAVVEGDHRAGDEIQVLRQANGQHRLEQQVVVPLPVLDAVVV